MIAHVRLALFASAVALVACQQQRPAPPPAPAPRIPMEQVVRPPVLVAPPVLVGADTARASASAPEPTVTIETYDKDIDVRTALGVIAKAGGYNLVLSPDIKKRVQVHLNDAPVSVALEQVLRAAGLTLAASTGPVLTKDTAIVFYQLPVNVDSLSVEAIMRRFGVSRSLAELMVSSRKQP